VRKLVLAVIVIAACRPAAVQQGSSETGAANPRGAVDGYLAAVRAQDIQALGGMWGDSRGPARTTIPRDEFEMRAVVLQCYTSHDRSRILSGPTQKADTVLFNVELTKGERPAFRTTAKVVEGPASRWYVVVMEPVPNFCAGR
jgi:hypothetical protein